MGNDRGRTRHRHRLEFSEHCGQFLTHGRQVGQSKLGRRFAPKLYRHYIHGYYSVEGRHLYVNKGLSYGQRVQSWCRPEMTVFKMTMPTENVQLVQ